MYEGRWYAAGSSVRTREACLSCACAHGALSCRRRACAPLPEPPPRCHILHQRGECCPELRCPACVEGGTVYAAGSAMSSNTACEQCFCLGGMRRCVRPVCLPPPPGCKARPAAGACCPQRYYCDHTTTKPPSERNPHDCITPEGKWAFEGERVISAETVADCVQCFCLRGSVRCQHLSCAPTLQGCKPLVQPGQCCPHQYQCGHKNGTKPHNPNVLRMDILIPLKNEVRSFHSSKATKRETTIKEVTTGKSTSAVTVTGSNLITTMKTKRNTEDSLISNPKQKQFKSALTTLDIEQTTQPVNDVSTTENDDYTTEDEYLEMTTEQPEGSVKIIINGTINCTAELSSTSLFLNVSNDNDSLWIKSDTQPRIPIIENTENHTYSPMDIITNNDNSGVDDNETFTINVTSSLRSNTTHTTSATTIPSSVRPKTVPPALLGVANISKVKKEETDYDYIEPTLPPSLPNLKIIPFVAADAVVDDDEVASKESLDYPLLETDDKFPVYYHTKETDQSLYAMRKEDIYSPTQYPVFVSKKTEPQYSNLSQEDDLANVQYPSITNEVPAQVQEYTVTASMGNSKINHNIDSKLSMPISNKFDVETPAINLFSPPVETEGGFVPKDIGIDEYYSVYKSTPVPIVPHLTTSMQLEPKGECLTSDGRRLSDGETISIACSVCSCAWGQLHCSPRLCSTPPGCKRRAASLSTSDLCCGELVCDQFNQTTSSPFFSSNKFALTLNESKVPLDDKEDIGISSSQNTTISSAVNMTKYNNSEVKHDINGLANKEPKTDKPSTSIKPITSNTPNLYETTTIKLDKEPLENNNHSIEYDEEDEDEGFSLGSVLQLLLSETYETTATSSPTRKTTKVTPPPPPPPKYFTTTSIATNKVKLTTAPDDAFIPVTHRFPIIPPKKIYPQHPVNRIDHLVLGESNTIRRTTLRPFKPISYTTIRKPIATTKTTQKPLTTKLLEITSKEGYSGHSVEVRPPTQNLIPGLNIGLPKLAGCNIYGRMYRVGRIIAELSSPCQECKCTELGVQCRSLNC
ncbi:unnamed protein product [Euphydryas editha]|uniref:VWFC domain-containing protein n=1 Tax=Euphydryas editha TaxID=104508 RepID=A0AAU9TN69_EUPED|nr:unnamed protein product [Euphydryas editha]